MAFVAYLVGSGLFAVAQSVAAVEFTDGQAEFLVLIGVLGPIVAMVLVWAKNYRYGAPLLVATTATTGWFSLYFFAVHDNPANVSNVARGAYTYAVVAIVFVSVVTGAVGAWLWYVENEGFRSAVDRVIFPPESRE